MATFLTGKALYDKIYDIIWKAEKELFIVSPYIKLDDYFKTLFEKHKHNHRLKISIIFGKNESQPGRSLRAEDLEFFKQFRNISIVYAADLHAKYYCNEKEGIITSINLYDKSFEKNIEFGVHYDANFWDEYTNTVDIQAYRYALNLLNQSPAVLIKRPVYESGLLSSLLSKNYIDTETLYDGTDAITYGYRWAKENKRFVPEFPESLDSVDKRTARPEKEVPAPAPQPAAKAQPTEKAGVGQGYCIRTGVVIKFNPDRPMTYDAYKSWAQWENWDYTEKYCHRCGTQAEVSMRKPLCYNCYKATA